MGRHPHQSNIKGNVIYRRTHTTKLIPALMECTIIFW